MPAITKFYRCGYCGKKQAYVEEYGVSEGDGRVAGVHYFVRCRGCAMCASYGASFLPPDSLVSGPLPPWPGPDQAAAALINCYDARQKRIHAIHRERQLQEDQAWANLLENAREAVEATLVLGLPETGRLKLAILQLEYISSIPEPDGFVEVPGVGLPLSRSADDMP